MSLQTINKFSKVLSNYQNGKQGIQSAVSVSNKEFFDSFQIFYTEYLSYSNTILKGKQFSDRELADYIFEFKFKTKTHYKELLRRELFAAILYLNHITDKISEVNIYKYSELLSLLRTDLEDLTADIEVNYLNSAKTVNLHSWRKRNKEINAIFSVSKTLFFIDDIEKIDEIYKYDIRPYSIFPVRQLIEMYGKEILGLIVIEDQKGNFSKKHLNSAWSFIKEEIEKGDSSRIKIPFDVEIILKIQKWTNRFVHTTIDASYYVIFSAIRMMYPLFKSDIDSVDIKNGIKIFDGTITIRLGFADVKLEQYNSLKKSFEEYINKGCKKSNQFIPIWKEENQVRSYIISL